MTSQLTMTADLDRRLSSLAMKPRSTFINTLIYVFFLIFARHELAYSSSTLPSVAELRAKYPSVFDSSCVSPYSDGLFHPGRALIDFRKEPFDDTNVFAFEAIARAMEVHLRRIADSGKSKVKSLRDICDKDQLTAAGFEDEGWLPGNRIDDLDVTQQALLDGLNDSRIPQAVKDEFKDTLKAFPSFTLTVVTIRFEGEPFKVGGVVKIRGQGFTGATSVLFGTIPAVSFHVVSDTYLTAVIPKNPTGHLVVVTPKARLKSKYRFYPDDDTGQ
jgi:hypothetical protein